MYSKFHFHHSSKCRWQDRFIVAMKIVHGGRWLKKFLKTFAVLFFLLGLKKLTNYIDNRGIQTTKYENCSLRIPKDSEIITDNKVWQVLHAFGKKRLKFFNAYLDTRRSQAYVRVNANGPKVFVEKPDLYCQFWYGINESFHYEVVKASEVQNMVPSLYCRLN
jgi:hypothetical protein